MFYFKNMLYDYWIAKKGSEDIDKCYELLGSCLFTLVSCSEEEERSSGKLVHIKN